jgi:hypothetical protein
MVLTLIDNVTHLPPRTAIPNTFTRKSLWERERTKYNILCIKLEERQPSLKLRLLKSEESAHPEN